MELMHKRQFPIETPEALKFWASRHKCNRMKAIIAFSDSLASANMNLKRMGYRLNWRVKALNNFGMYVNNPGMIGVPLSLMETPWWKCMPYKPGALPPPGKLCLWVDAETWIDADNWTEVCDVNLEEVL